MKIAFPVQYTLGSGRGVNPDPHYIPWTPGHSRSLYTFPYRCVYTCKGGAGALAVLLLLVDYLVTMAPTGLPITKREYAGTRGPWTMN